MLDLTTTITGTAVGGLTAPTFTLTTDQSPSNNSRQSIVTALGGTQTGVRTHSPSDPFSITVVKPVVPVSYPKANLQGVLGKAGRNKYSILVRKGTIPLVGQNPQISSVRIDFDVVSGAEVNDKANIAAMLSAAAAYGLRELANEYLMVTTGSI